jgi:spermidine/putrescine transport system permease protein
MIGNVIQSQFLSLRNYPTAAALSFVLMGAILLLVIAFSLALGTDRLTGGAAT